MMNEKAIDDGAYRLLVEAVIDYALFLLDPEGRVCSWNPGAQRIKGYCAEEIVGQSFSVFFTEEDRRSGLPERALAEARRAGRFESEGWRVRKDGSRFWALAVLDAVRDDAGHLVGFAKITRDMTERQEAQRAAEEMRERMAQIQRLEALGQLSAGIAHSFSNLIQIILSGVRLADAASGDADRLLRILAHIGDAAQQRTGLTEHLLAFAQNFPTDPKVIDTGKQIREVADLFSRAHRGRIRVDLDLADDLWPIRADAAQFELALLNVVLNARDAMPEGGLLSITARNMIPGGESTVLEGRTVSISLRDTGAGIPKGLLGRVLEPFFTTKPRSENTGLGLSQAYGFAEQAGGALRIESEPGQGTQVKFLLPAAAATFGKETGAVSTGAAAP